MIFKNKAVKINVINSLPVAATCNSMNKRLLIKENLISECKEIYVSVPLNFAPKNSAVIGVK